MRKDSKEYIKFLEDKLYKYENNELLEQQVNNI